MDDTQEKSISPEGGSTPSRKKPFLALAALIVITAVITVGIIIKNRDSNPFPKYIRDSTNFPLYYPAKLPKGYSLKKDSLTAQNGIVFYTLTDGDNTITTSEQSTPSNRPDLTSIPAFGEVASSSGQAGSGVVNGLPVAILITEKTMINIQGSKGTSKELVSNLASSMVSNSQ